jgi:hypothetical protein
MRVRYESDTIYAEVVAQMLVGKWRRIFRHRFPQVGKQNRDPQASVGKSLLTWKPAGRVSVGGPILT